ncbi:MAG: YibE/F family protein [Pygmaiobacter sp.]|nr:YibE/F family protein [Pygmaiobacter sp.]
MKSKSEQVSPKTVRVVLYVLTVLLSVGFLYAGNRLAAAGGGVLPPLTGADFLPATVQTITSREVSELPGLAEGQTVQQVTLRFIAKQKDGSTVAAQQVIDGYSTVHLEEVRVGNRVLLYPNPDPATTATAPYVLDDYQRADGTLAVCVVFCILLLIFGRMKGLHTLVSLLLTIGVVFFVFLPLVLGGYNIYLSTIAVCIYVIVSTLLLVNGANAKTLVAIVGCSAGVLFAGLLTVLLSNTLRLTGMASQEAIYLADLGTRNPVDLKAIVFAGILIGAVGAVMDVAMSLASALWELREGAAAPTFGMLLKSGMNIGRDMMSTMANTLVLAYIGSSLSTVLLLVAYASSLDGLFNREMIITEVLQAVIGSMAILLAIPLTSFVASAVYTRRKQPPKTI